MVLNQFARVVISFALLCLPLAAQQPQDAPTHVTLQGIVQTPDKTPVPGASVHIVEQNSGKSWITWTDETGKFRLPELPAGKFHIDVSQIGFGSDARDVAPTTEKSDDIVMVLKISSASEIAAANAATMAANAPVTAATTPTAPATGTDVTKSQTATTTPPAADQTKPATGAKPDATKPATQTARNGRGGQNGQQGGGARGGGFSQVEVNGAGGTADTNDQTGGAGADSSGLGAAASSDALLVAGTTAQGDRGGFPMMMGMGGDNGGDPNNPGIPGQALGLPGQTGDNGMPGGGGPGGGGGGRGPGGGGPGGGGGGRGGGGQGGGGRGGRGGQGNNGVPWGLNSVIRKRINQMHYTLNETLLDSAFNARTWQANGQEQPKLSSDTNRFGGSLGGPLRIPHLYDGRDKTFFFLNVNIGHGNTANFLTGNVPTNLERAGNFCSSGTDPTTGLAVPINIYNFASSSPSNLQTPRTLLNPSNPCNISGLINPTAAALLALVPSPNQTPTLNNPNNYLLQVATPTNNQTVSMRVSQTISPKLNFGVQYNISQQQLTGQGLFPVETSSSSRRAQVATITFNQNISPRLINAIVLNFTRSRSNGVNGFANSVDEEALLGITGGSSNPLNFGLPTINLNSSNGGLSYSGFNDVIPSLTRNETWNLTDTLSWTHGKHATHFGATFRRVQTNTDADTNPRGAFTFTGVMSENFTPSTDPHPFTAIANTGSPLADFELGLPQGTSVQFGDTFNYLRSRAFITYFTDDWKIKPRFTLTYGLRYELVLPATELFGHLADLDVNPADFTQVQQVTPASNVGAFSGALPASLIRPNYKNLAPRVSVAWRVPGKYFEANNGKHALIVRAGYNIFDNSNSYGVIDNHLLNQAPFATNIANSVQVPTAPLSFTNGLLPTTSISNINTYAVNPNYRNPVVQIWNVSLESQFIDGFTWQLSYIGTKGSYLDVYSAPNLLNVTNNLLAAQGLPVPIVPTNLTYTYDSSGASSIYNALQIRLQKRMRNGFTFTTIYTYSKSIDDSSSIGGSGQAVIQDFPNFNVERGLSSFDRRNVITGNSTYELPFGERKRFAHKGAEARILGNWRLSGSATFQTGAPLQPIVQGELTAINSGNTLNTRPDIFAGCDQNLLSSQRSVSEFFNISCFAAPGKQFPASPEFPSGGPFAPVGLAGNAGRDIVRGPSSIIVNMALSKSITLGRDAQKHLDLRWEVNNLANHPNDSSIGLAVGTRNFGEVLGAGAMRTMQAVIRLNF